MKSESSSKPHPKYRLKKTLKRKPTYRDLGEDDLKYLWALYKKGGLGVMEDGLDPQGFDEAIRNYLTSVYDHGWVLEAQTKKGRMPVGVVFGLVTGKLTIIGDMLWFPWASWRNKAESAVGFINHARKDHLLLFWTPKDDVRKRKFLEYIAKHGIAKRVGTLDDLTDEPLALFQSRKPMWKH
jgi:hypothetical protein